MACLVGGALKRKDLNWLPSETEGISRQKDTGKTIDSKWLLKFRSVQVSGSTGFGESYPGGPREGRLCCARPGSYTQVPGGVQSRYGERLPPAAFVTGRRKPARIRPMSFSSAGAPARPSRATKARHCVCLDASSRNSAVNANGTPLGRSVRLRSKVPRIARASGPISNVCDEASIRLFAMPSSTMA